MIRGLNNSRPTVLHNLQSGHPLAVGLVSAYTFTEPGGPAVVDHIGPNRGTVAGNPTRISRGMVFDGTGDWVDLKSRNIISTTKPFTVCWKQYLDGFAVQSYPAPWFLLGNGAGSEAYITFHTNDQAGYGGLNGGSGTDWARWKSTSAAAVFATKWVSCALTYNGAGATTLTNYSLHINGVADALSANDGIGGTTNTNRVGGDTGNEFDGNVEYFYIYNRVLSVPEIKWLAFNPYSFFMLPKRVWFGAAAAGATAVPVFMHHYQHAIVR